MRTATKKLTTAAVCTALAVIMCVFTAYLPFSFMPLYLAAFSIFLACKRGSLPYGLLSAAATVGIMFAMTGLSVSWFMLLLMFAPYAILAYFMHRFDYFKPKSGIIRGVVVAAFFNMTMGFVYLVATRVVTIGIDIPIDEWVRALGGYWVLALVGTLVLVPLDFIFSTLSIYVLKRIPDPDGGSRRPPPADKKADADKKPATADTSDESNEQENRSGGGETEKKYDIFGYEITDDGDDKDAKR